MYVCMFVCMYYVCMYVCIYAFIYLQSNDINNSEYTVSIDIGSMNNEFRTMCKHHHSVPPQPVVPTRHWSHSTTHQVPAASLLLRHHLAVFDSCYRAIFVVLIAVLWVLTAISTYTKLLPFRGCFYLHVHGRSHLLGSFRFFTLEDGTDGIYRNVRNKLPLYAT